MRKFDPNMRQIGLEKFAQARAKLDAGLDRDAVLAEARVDAATWIHEQESILTELADDVERADFTRIESYRAAYRIAWAEVTELAAADVPKAVEISEMHAAPPTFADKSTFAFKLSGIPADFNVEETLPPPELTERAKIPLPFTPAPAHPEGFPPSLPSPTSAGQAKPDNLAHPETFVAPVPDNHPVDATLVAVGRVTANPLPFQAAPSSEMMSGSSSRLTFRLTLDQYAALCAEIAVFPEQAERVLRQYGFLSLDEKRALDRVWHERLRLDSTEHREWQVLYERYKHYFSAPARRDGPR
jgi:hypothetical protein